MRIFETTHGQVTPQEYYKNDYSLPVGNDTLTPLGREQARLLGKRLKALHFNGVIFSSPYDRTMETASIIAEELGRNVTPLVALREIVTRVDEFYYGATAKTLAERYVRAYFDEKFPNVWWGDGKEEISDVIERLETELKTVLSALPKETDVLLVGHATTSVALRHLFDVTENNLDFHWNCHLSLLYSSSGETYANDCGHLPEKMRTENGLLYMEQQQEFVKNVQAVRCLSEGNDGKKTLHVGDTHSANYPYYERLIEAIKPDVIVHTGDLADELKAGRIESVRSYWKRATKEILKIMAQSGARVIIVAGNNDLAEELKTLAPNAEIVPRNTVLKLHGKSVCVCHEVWKIDPSLNADVYLYGHGLTGETREKEDNERDGKLYFNAVWGASLHVLEKDVHYIISKA